MRSIIGRILLLLAAIFITPAGSKGTAPEDGRWEMAGGDYIYSKDGVCDFSEPSMEVSMPALGDRDTYGDACLIQSDGASLLVDTCLEGGADILASFLEEKRVEEMSVLLTHYHNDHIGALPALLEGDIAIDTIYMPDPYYMYGDGKEDIYDFNKSYGYMDEIVSLAEEKGTRIQYVGKGDTFGFGLVKAEVIYQKEFAPFKGLKPSSYINNLSLCTMFTCGNVRFLSCGDIQERTENMMLEDGIDISADIFKMSHHGGRTSNTDDFLKKVGASVMYFNCPFSEEGEGILDNDWTRERTESAQEIGNVYHSVINRGLTISVRAGRITVEGENTRKVTCTAYRGTRAEEMEVTVQGAGDGSYVITDMLLPCGYTLEEGRIRSCGAKGAVKIKN